jgi:hypothetical protein
MNNARFSLCAFIGLFLWLSGCSTPLPKVPDPLEGWASAGSLDVGNHLDKAITDDYNDYISKLPPGEKRLVTPFYIRFAEDHTGQHAVIIEIPIRGITWKHVLIYNDADQRINTIKYASGAYQS